MSPSATDPARINLVCTIVTATGATGTGSFTNIASNPVTKLNANDLNLAFFRDYYGDNIAFTIDRLQIYHGALSAPELLALDLADNGAPRTESEALLRFDLGAVNSVGRALLQLHLPVLGTDTTSHTLHLAGATGSWSEGGVTWNNRPTAGPLLQAFAAPNNSGQVLELDVTSYLAGELAAGRPQVSFALSHPASTLPTPVALTAREGGAQEPRLLIRGTVAGIYAGWMQTYASLTGADALAGADPDRDGLPNLAEHVLGGNPTQRDHATWQPTVGSTSSIDGHWLTITYTRQPTVTGVQCFVQASPTLAPAAWTNVADSLVSTLSDGREVRRAQVPLIGAQQFVRLWFGLP